MTKYIISSRNYVLQFYQAWKLISQFLTIPKLNWKAVWSSSQFWISSGIQLLQLTIQNKQTSTFVQTKVSELRWTFAHFFKIQKVGSAKIWWEISVIQNYKVQWIIFFSVKRQQLRPTATALNVVSDTTLPRSRQLDFDKGQRTCRSWPNLCLGNWAK